MCKAHSKVTHIKQQKYFHHLKSRGYNKNSVLYPGCLRWWKYFCCFMCHFAMGLTHYYKTTVFFYICYIRDYILTNCRQYVFVATYIAELLLLLFQLQSHNRRWRVMTIKILRQVSCFIADYARDSITVIENHCCNLHRTGFSFLRCSFAKKYNQNKKLGCR